MTGQVFGKLTVLKRIQNKNGSTNARWLVKCICGNRIKVCGSDLRAGRIRGVFGCGCSRSEFVSNFWKRHGHAKNGKWTSTYRSWNGMRTRCNNPNSHDYEYYGGRGIKVCKRWSKYESFLEDMGERPDGMTLDRRDNGRSYTPSNCRWATHSEQNRNQRPRSGLLHLT